MHTVAGNPMDKGEENTISSDGVSDGDDFFEGMTEL